MAWIYVGFMPALAFSDDNKGCRFYLKPRIGPALFTDTFARIPLGQIWDVDYCRFVFATIVPIERSLMGIFLKTVCCRDCREVMSLSG